MCSKQRKEILSNQALAVGADKHALQFIFRMLTGALSLGELGLGPKGIRNQAVVIKAEVCCHLPAALPPPPPLVWLSSWTVIG